MYRVLTIVGIVLCLVAAVCPDLHAPCFSCEIYNMMHGDQPRPKNTIRLQCTYPCSCATKDMKCREGVNVIKEGCGCCYMCARQQGEYCDHKQKCDEKKGFWCDFKHNGGHSGVCRAKEATPCIIDGEIYKDGEQFKPDCQRLCTCQNGHYGCVSLCPQETTQPSGNCKNPRLVAFQGKCCKEWVCDSDDKDKKDPRSKPDKNKQPKNDKHTAVAPPADCKRETSAWSSCSVTCGMGLSVRVTNDNQQCEKTQQVRFCMVRPCELPGGKLSKDGRCTPTLKPKAPRKLSYKDCISVKSYRPKYCSACKKNKCCVPHITKTIPVSFYCKHGHKESRDFMWIKNCKCHKNCPR